MSADLEIDTGSGRVVGAHVVAARAADGSAMGASVAAAHAAATPVAAAGALPVRRWLGIPYAAAPVGALRWRPPAPCAPWTGVRAALTYGADFPQAPSPILRAGRMSEDCLYLNIWSPADAAPGSLPVMVWVHGGGFVGGSGADARTEGHLLAARGVVVVSFNYRSGLFGWLAHPGLSAEGEQQDGARTSGNYGLLDQLAALQWVRQNIAAFGGDAARITAFGVSAGSASIALMLTMPAAAGLFQRAILHSPGCGRPLASLAQAEDAAVAALGSDLDALRALDASTLLARTPRINPAVRGLTTPRVLRPIRDGHFVPDEERQVLLAARQRRMPLIVGTNADEGSQLTLAWPVPDAAAARALLEANFTPAPARERALALYGPASEHDARASVASAFADTQFNGGARLLLRAMARVEPRCHGYRFTRRRPGRVDGPHHGDEAAYVFGHLAVGRTAEAQPYDAQDVAVSEAMAAAWVAFAKGDDLEAAGTLATPWPCYDLADERWLEFGDTLAPVRNPHDERLDFLDRYLDGGMPATTLG
jgi:para-nitrobenzyl esterase